ncbi:MAG: hypothetical protein PHT83_01405 [Bacilli bacterium]|nr:hypothetical protein [Bacilli bacterium]
MKNIIIKIGLSILGIGLIIFIYFISMPNISNGSITIILIDEAGVETINEVVEFNEYTNGEKTTLYILLNERYDILVDSSGFLKEFESVKTDGVNDFIKILKNDALATKGIKTLDFKDKDIIKFVYTSVGDFS